MTFTLALRMPSKVEAKSFGPIITETGSLFSLYSSSPGQIIIERYFQNPMGLDRHRLLNTLISHFGHLQGSYRTAY
jgi:hypothetical protein